MNIRAAMAALELSGIDSTAAHAVLVVCCRADRYSGVAAVSTKRIAADMKVNRKTAASALTRAVTARYLAVDKRTGRSPVWRLADSLTCVKNAQGVSKNYPWVDQPGRTRRSKKETIKEQGGAHSAENPENLSVENWTPDLPPNPWVLDEETGAAAYVRSGHYSGDQ